MFAKLLKYEVRHVDHVCLWLLINLVAKRNTVWKFVKSCKIEMKATWIVAALYWTCSTVPGIWQEFHKHHDHESLKVLYKVVQFLPTMCLAAQSCSALCDPTDCSLPDSSVHGDSPGKNTGVGCHALLQGIIPTQGSNPALSHWRQILYCPSHQRSPRILAWVAYPFSRGTSQPRNRTGVSCIADRVFISWATWEAHFYPYVTDIWAWDSG